MIWNKCFDQCTCCSSFSSAYSALFLDPARLSVISLTTSAVVNGSIEILEGSPVNINCISDSKPAINSSTVYWTKNGAVVQYGGRLTIGSVQRSHRGLYSCSATNVMTPSGKQSYPVTSNLNVMLLVLCECSFFPSTLVT